MLMCTSGNRGQKRAGSVQGKSVAGDGRRCCDSMESEDMIEDEKSGVWESWLCVLSCRKSLDQLFAALFVMLFMRKPQEESTQVINKVSGVCVCVCVCLVPSTKSRDHP